MKILWDLFEKARPDFEKGGKFEKLYPLFEAKETFTFVTPDRTKKGSHIRDALDTKRLMSTVIIALIPCVLMGIYNCGYQYYMSQGVAPQLIPCVAFGAIKVMPIIIVSYAVGGIWELIFAVVRKHEINEGFLVTGLLFPLTLPPSIPLWMVAAGVSFGVVIGKEVFGGTGMNIFNPALTARAFVFFAYPASISGDRVWAVTDPEKVVHGYSGATPLLVGSVPDEAKTPVLQKLGDFGETAAGERFASFDWIDCFVGLIPGSIGETSTLACIIGAVILVATGVGSARIMIGVLAGATCMGLLLNAAAGDDTSSFLAMPLHYHYVSGGFAFGLVYMATDPVSGCNTVLGKWIYGFLIGNLAILIRVINPAYPEGVMLSILFMNAFAPLIDFYVVDFHIKKRRRRATEALAT